MQNTISWVMVTLLLVGLGLYMFFSHRTSPAGPSATSRVGPEYPNLYTHVDAENTPFAMIVLLKAPRRLDRSTLTRVAENAFHIQFNPSTGNRLLSQPRPSIYAVITPSFRLGVMASSRPYFEDSELPAILEREYDPAVRRALEDHE